MAHIILKRLDKEIMMKLFNATEYYENFEYPEGLEKVVDLGLTDLDLWFILEAPFAEQYFLDMQKRYPERKLVPFAKRTDCDDVACFEIDKPRKVEIIHDFADPGWEQRAEFPDFWAWFKGAMDEFIETSIEEENEKV